MIMYVMKFQNELPRLVYRLVFQYCLVSLQPKILSRQSSVQERRQEIRDMTVRYLPLKW